MEQRVEKKMGWEIARDVEATKKTMGERAKLSGATAEVLSQVWGVVRGACLSLPVGWQGTLLSLPKGFLRNT
jgi:hypothetical protein